MRKDASRERRKPSVWADLTKLNGMHSGKRCYVVGAGSSLAFLNLAEIHHHVVIAVNSAALLMSWNQGDKDKRFWISNDVLCLQWDYFWSHVLKSHCTKIVRTSWRKYNEKICNYNFQYFSPRKKDTEIDSDDGGLCSVSSVPSAIDLAMRLGCKDIYLLGIDQRMVHGNSHFWQFWDRSKWPQRLDKERNFRPEQKHQTKIFDQNLDVFKALKRYAEKTETKILNCNLQSHLDVFEKISYEDSLL